MPRGSGGGITQETAKQLAEYDEVVRDLASDSGAKRSCSSTEAAGIGSIRLRACLIMLEIRTQVSESNGETDESPAILVGHYRERALRRTCTWHAIACRRHSVHCRGLADERRWEAVAWLDSRNGGGSRIAWGHGTRWSARAWSWLRNSTLWGHLWWIDTVTCLAYAFSLAVRILRALSPR